VLSKSELISNYCDSKIGTFELTQLAGFAGFQVHNDWKHVAPVVDFFRLCKNLLRTNENTFMTTLAQFRVNDDSLDFLWHRNSHVRFPIRVI
jgi:hypothetical protein